MQNGNIGMAASASKSQPHPPEIQGHVGDLVVRALGLRLHLLLQPPLEVPGTLVAPGGTDRLEHGLRVEIGLLTVTHQVSEVSEVALDLGASWRRAVLKRPENTSGWWDAVEALVISL